MGNRKSSLRYCTRDIEENNEVHIRSSRVAGELTSPPSFQSRRSNSFQEMKYQLHRQPTLFTRDDSTIGATLRQILYHEELGPIYREFARHKIADENILLIDAITQYRQGSNETNKYTCRAIWFQFIAENSPRQVNINSKLMNELQAAFYAEQYVECLELLDIVMFDCLNDIKKSDIFRMFLKQNEKATELYMSFNENMLHEWFSIITDVEEVVELCNNDKQVECLIRLVVYLKDTLYLGNAESKHHMSFAYMTFMIPSGNFYIGELAAKYKHAFRLQRIEQLNDAFIEYTRELSKYDLFSRQVRAKWKI